MPVKKAAKKVKGLSRFTKLNIIVFALLFAGIGTYLLVNSKALTNNGVISFHVIDGYTGATVSGMDIRIRSVYGEPSGSLYCTSTSGSTLTDAAGNVIYYKCPIRDGQSSETYRFYYWNAGANGYNFIDWPVNSTVNVSPSQKEVTIRVYKDPQVHISIAPNPINKGQSTRVTLQADYANTCSWAKGDGLAGTPAWNNVNVAQWRDVIPSATQSYEAWCTNTVSGRGAAGGATVTVNNPSGGGGGTPAPVINFFNASKYEVNPGETVSLSWTASNASTCYVGKSDGSWILTGQTYNNPGGINSPAISASSTFALACSGSTNPMASKQLTVTVKGSPPPPQPCPAGYTGTSQPNCTPPTATSTPPRVLSRVGGTAPAGASDQERPSVPANLKAEQSGNGGVDISWDASTDNIGVTGYTVERSTDGTNWEMLSDSVTETTYTDNTAEFNTKYSYRVSAFDSAGNYSDYAVADLTTNAFAPNVYADQDSTITSDDGIVTVNIPAGALKEDAFCEIKKDGVNSKPKGYKLVAGAYTIECKNAQGDSITSFEKEATVIMDLKDFKQYKKFAAYSIDGNNLSKINATFNDKDKTLTFKMTEFQTFAAYGAKGSSLWWLWLLILLLIGGLIFFIIRLRRSGGSDDSYYDTTNYVTMPPTEPVGPAGPQQHTSLPDMVAQGQQPPASGYQDPYAQYPGQPPAGPGAAQQPPQYPGNDQQYPPQYPPQNPPQA